MRWLVGLMCVLALGIMGCSETAAGPCIGLDDRTACTVDGSPGLCFDGGCRLFDCSGLANGTVCTDLVPGAMNTFFFGYCEDGHCRRFVRDCTGVQDGTPCPPGTADVGICVDGLCQIAYDCTSAEDGALCTLTESPTARGYGFCVDGSCEPPQ
jgi:hypothetical protein